MYTPTTVPALLIPITSVSVEPGKSTVPAIAGNEIAREAPATAKAGSQVLTFAILLRYKLSITPLWAYS